MTIEAPPTPPPAVREGFWQSGWADAAGFTFALSVLNVSYGLGHQLGAHPIALLMWAMPIAAISLLVVGGVGRDWRAVMAHPLSLVVGGGIIAMESAYYMLLKYASPTDGSLLVRIAVPVAMAMAYFASGVRPGRLSILGGVVIVATIAAYLPFMTLTWPLIAIGLAAACALIMTGRSFATEYHPWNRQARTVGEKMRITGLVLLLTSLLGAALVLVLVGAASNGLIERPAWLPSPQALVDPATVLLGVFLGALVLTAMQYFSFSTVVKVGTERFIAATALIPPMTLALQALAVSAGLLTMAPINWQVMPAMAAMLVGVLLVIVGRRRI